MKDLPMDRTNARDLYRTIMTPIKARLMMSALELGVFDELREFRPPEDVARSLGTHPESTGRLLDALAMIDLVEKESGLYRNRPRAEVFLTNESPCYLGGFFRMFDRMMIEPLGGLTDRVRHGPASNDGMAEMEAEELWARSAEATAAWVLGEVGVTFSRIVSGLEGFTDFQSMLDLGGGHGMFALYIVAAHPGMQGIVFDRPAVVRVAEKNIQEYGMADRVGVKAGDYMTDDIGSGYDLIWASATLNFAKFDMDALLRKVHGALNPGGYFISLQDGMTHEGTRPETMLGHMIDVLQTGVDFRLDQGFVAEAALRNGFQSVRSRTLDTPMGTLDLDVARKETAA